MDIVNKRIKELRESLGLSQEEFGKSIGLSKSGISNIESGNRKVKNSYIELICIKYSISKDWLLFGNELAKEVNELESFIKYLESIGYFVNVNQTSEETFIITVKNHNVCCDFTNNEFENLRIQSKKFIDGSILLHNQE